MDDFSFLPFGFSVRRFETKDGVGTEYVAVGMLYNDYLFLLLEDKRL